jgi:diguanylate cyclase (GGDEF)-like protein
VVCQDDGTVQVQDLGSTNGTAVNGQPVERSVLRPGDHLEVGAVSLRLDLLSLEEVAHLEGVIMRLEAKNRDPLTGLLTRAWLEEELPGLMDRSLRSGGEITCLFLDVDNFKSINDRFGHQIGDDVLVGVSRLLMVSVRDTDACVRFGGEEILLFLVGSNETQGLEVAERTRRAIATHDWTRTAPGLKVTASFGIAQWSGREATKDWIARADRALYAAKAAGRNRALRSSEVG